MLFIFVTLAFTFDHAVSEILYALGYDRNKISNIWFLRSQYAYLADVKHVAGLTVDPFHVFELFIWAMILLNLARVAKGIFFLGYADDVRSPWVNLSGGAYVLYLFLFSSACLAAIILIPDSSQRIFSPGLAPSANAAIGVEAWAFCVGTLFFADAILGFVQLNLGRLRRENG